MSSTWLDTQGEGSGRLVAPERLVRPGQWSPHKAKSLSVGRSKLQDKKRLVMVRFIVHQWVLGGCWLIAAQCFQG